MKKRNLIFISVLSIIALLVWFSCNPFQQANTNNSSELNILDDAEVIKATGATLIYVSPSGNDLNDGSLASPIFSLSVAIDWAVPGTTIYMMGGTYNYSATVTIAKSGDSSNLIKVLPYNSEKPVLDFSRNPSASRGFFISGSYWQIKGLTIQNATNHGLTIDAGSYVTIENCTACYNNDMGINITGGAAYCQIINCDSYYNFDVDDNGENADGFGAKYDLGAGNVFKGCRAWHNSDDGYDLWGATAGIRFEDCWAWENGDNFKNASSFAGDGNGFKLGASSGRHIMIRCVSWNNLLANGFEDNNDTAGVEYLNCTAYNNKGYNFETTAAVTHIVKNNISYLSKGVNIISTSDCTNNSWQGYTVAAADFESLSDIIAKGQRNADGILPVSSFLRLSATSQFIDKGVNVGLPYLGTAPDLGAYELR